MLAPEGFEDIECFEDVLPEIDMWNGENVLFCKAKKVDGEIEANQLSEPHNCSMYN
jgi:hypothetical protein